LERLPALETIRQKVPHDLAPFIVLGLSRREPREGVQRDVVRMIVAAHVPAF
jgi:hypothetical protein